jgi:2-oxoglutarate ferredoxin oxidoreductase subunit gamma
MQHELVISGVGGQGILVASQLLGHSVVVEGKRAMYFSMFQGAQRGGVCECLVVIADGRVEASPVIMQPLVRRGGLLVYNTSITMGTSDTKQSTGEGLALKADTTIELKPSRTDIALLGIPATDLAMNELGNQLQATLIALGAFIEISSIVSIESAKGSLAKTLPPHRQHFIPLNEQALDLGAKWAREKGELQNASALSLLGREAVHA